MLRLRYVAPFAGALMSGCAVLPPFAEMPAAQPEVVINQVRCELHEAYLAVKAKNADTPLKTWVVTYQLTSKADHVGAGGLASGTWIVPGGVTVGATALATQQKFRQGLVRYASGFATVDGEDCNRPGEPDSTVSVFADNLGIGDWLDRALLASTQESAPNSLGYTVSFSAKVDASVRPAVAFTNVSAGGTLGGSSAATHLLDLAFTPPGPRFQRVCVVEPTTGECVSPFRSDAEATNAEAQNVLESLRSNTPGF